MSIAETEPAAYEVHRGTVNTTNAMEGAMTTEQTITDMIGNAADRLVKVDARLSNLADHVDGIVEASIAGGTEPAPSLLSTARKFTGAAEDTCNTIGRLSHLLVLSAPVEVKDPTPPAPDLVTVRDEVTYASTRINDAIGGMSLIMSRVDGAEPEAEVGARNDTLRGDVERATDMVERLAAMAETLIASVGTK